MWHATFRKADGPTQLAYMKRAEKWIRFKLENKQQISYFYKTKPKSVYIQSWFAVHASYKLVVDAIEKKRKQLEGISIYTYRTHMSTCFTLIAVLHLCMYVRASFHL